MMFLSECKNNRIPYVILCLITLGSYGLGAYELHHATPEEWRFWRFALIAGAIYLFLIYDFAIDFSVINTLCIMAALWGVIAVLFVLCAFVTWKLPDLGPDLINYMLMMHYVISLMSAVGGRMFQLVQY